MGDGLEDVEYGDAAPCAGGGGLELLFPLLLLLPALCTGEYLELGDDPLKWRSLTKCGELR